MAGIRSEPLNSSGKELQPCIGRNEKTLAQRDFSRRIALAFLKPQLVLSEHAVSSIEKEITRLRTSVWWLWMSSTPYKKLAVALGPAFTS